MKILLYCATQPQYPFVHPLTLECIWAQQWDGPLDIMFGVQVEGESAHPYEDLNDKMNRARTTVLNGDYDALYLIEADMIVPFDGLQRLAAVEADVAYGLYCSRHSKRGRPDGHKWLAFHTAIEDSSIVWSAFPERVIRRKVWGQVKETAGLGFGCTLIHRHVLEAISFRTYPGYAVSNDWTFSLDCQAHGFKQAHDFGLICGHILQGGDRAVWPDIDAPNLHRIEDIDDGIPNYSGQRDQAQTALCTEEIDTGIWADSIVYYR